MFSTKVGYIKSALYYYEYNESSICSLSLKNKVFYEWVDVVDYIGKLFAENKETFNELNILKIKAKSSLLYSKNVFNPKLWRKIYKDVNKLNLLLNTSFPLKYRIIHFLAFCRMDALLWMIALVYSLNIRR